MAEDFGEICSTSIMTSASLCYAVRVGKKAELQGTAEYQNNLCRKSFLLRVLFSGPNNDSSRASMERDFKAPIVMWLWCSYYVSKYLLAVLETARMV